jgi:hypothetical protein
MRIKHVGKTKPKTPGRSRPLENKRILSLLRLRIKPGSSGIFADLEG